MKKLAFAFLAAGGVAAALLFQVSAQEASPPAISRADAAQAVQDFNTTCAGCHGEDAGGGDRAPALVDNPHLRTLDAAGIEAIIRSGQRAMPPFPNLPQAEVSRLAAWLHSMNISGLQSAPPEQVAAGEATFFGTGVCSGCHMVHGSGGFNGRIFGHRVPQPVPMSTARQSDPMMGSNRCHLRAGHSVTSMVMRCRSDREKRADLPGATERVALQTPIKIPCC